MNTLNKSWRWSGQSNRGSRAWHCLVLCLAALTMMAFKPYCPSLWQIVRVWSDGPVVYAQARLFPTYKGIEGPAYARSQDGGETWKAIDPPSHEAPQTPELPITVADPTNSAIAYRIVGDKSVYESVDGGHTWKVAWRPPLGRETYRDRARCGLTDLCDYEEERYRPDPRDLTIVHVNGAHVIVAMGNEGVLVREPDGKWVQRGVLDTAPTRWRGNLATVLGDILPELQALVPVFVLVITILLSVACWTMVTHVRGSRDVRVSWIGIMWPAVTVVVVYELWAIYVWSLLLKQYMQDFINWNFFGVIFFFLVPILWLISSYRVWRLAPSTEPARKARTRCFLSTLWAALGGALCFALWALGVIPSHTMALILAIVVIIGFTIDGARRVRRLALLAAARPPDTPDMPTSPHDVWSEP